MKILGYEYTVEAMKKTVTGNLGDCDSDHLHIRIATDMPQQQIESVVLHEILEALNHHLNLSFGDDNKVILPLEAGLYATLIANGVDLSPLARLVKKNQP